MNSYYGAYKLWGVFNGNLTNGTYFLNIFNSYDVTKIQGSKTFSISGGVNYWATPNNMLLMCLIVYGLCSLIIAIVLTTVWAKQKTKNL